MFNFKTQLLGAAAVVPIAAAGLLASAGTAQALTLNGSLSLDGTAQIPNDGVNPAQTKIIFKDVDGVDASGDFATLFPPLQPNSNISLKPLNLTKIANIINSGPLTRATYSTGGVIPFIDFGIRTLGATTAQLTFDLDNSVVTRTRTGNANIAHVTLDGITGKFNFDGKTIASGFLNASLSGSTSAYELSLTTVPEPATILGLGVVGAGMAFAGRRKLVKAA
jgi:hypothetical protein